MVTIAKHIPTVVDCFFKVNVPVFERTKLITLCTS